MRIQPTPESTPYHEVKRVGPTNEAFQNGVKYALYFQRMSDDRLQLYHMNTMTGHSGHKVYDSLTALAADFEIDEIERKYLKFLKP